MLSNISIQLSVSPSLSVRHARLIKMYSGFVSKKENSGEISLMKKSGKFMTNSQSQGK